MMMTGVPHPAAAVFAASLAAFVAFGATAVARDWIFPFPLSLIWVLLSTVAAAGLAWMYARREAAWQEDEAND